jgi:hypothetical protein
VCGKKTEIKIKQTEIVSTKNKKTDNEPKFYLFLFSRNEINKLTSRQSDVTHPCPCAELNIKPEKPF